MKYFLLFASVNDCFARVLSFIFALDVTKHKVQAASISTLFHVDPTKNPMNYGLCFPMVQRKCILIFIGRLRGDQVNCCAKYLTIRTIRTEPLNTFLLRSKLICIARELPFENSGLYFLVQKRNTECKKGIGSLLQS